MTKKIHVQASPLTNVIYAGSVSKDGTSWLSNRTDVTNEAICAVADHAIKFKAKTGKDLELTVDGKVVTRIIVEDLTK